MSSASKIIQAAAGNAAGEGLYVEEVFSTYLYEGTGSAQTITNDIDLDGEGGLVWVKWRSGAVGSGAHVLVDTERGVNYWLSSSATSAQNTTQNSVTSFNSNGFSIVDAGGKTNYSGDDYVSWTFRKAPKFFDVVTYTGTGSATTVSHNLGSVPGCIIVKRTDTTGDWQVYHRANTANPETDYLVLNSTAATADSNTRWNDTAPTASVFTVGTEATVNASGGTYVAYLFAHNNGDGDFGESGDQDIIKCGSYTGTGSSLDVSLGFEPQWILVKRTDSTSFWTMWDVMRGLANNGTSDDRRLKADTSDAESNSPYGHPTATGFTVTGTNTDYNASGGTYIYIAIRRGPMKTPESGTEVFAAAGRGDTGVEYYSGFPVDFIITHFGKNVSGNFKFTRDRLRGGSYLLTHETDAEVSATYFFDSNVGYRPGSFTPNNIYFSWMFRRAPGFFDVVAYEGNGTAGRTVSHNLGVVPEMMWVKNRDTAYAWKVYHSTPGETKYAKLSDRDAFGTATAYWNDTVPTSSVFTVGTGVDVNASGDSIIAYLFATLPGVSKVGSYTGNGTSQTIDCGFSAGARFVMTKRTNTTGNWNVWDSERGIVAGNDPRLELNTTDAEDTGHDYIDPDSSGFVVNYVADDDDDSNVSGDTYIFLAIA